ncbi:hypothetical protein [Myceligenerans pegani]|uniref:YxiG-like domain-containing protein n=1 Tax=Myceligenerans pegani TaxID=2776917 RepID=A0ABR9MVH6_9MICO|nr:hypothetical protein [Myceligenerans sp. TRM 65318]MBE1875389.1 hypothetical protein [Myceligenerans sp. TRM 65318]MBE3017660.1 hypothetical protein [Myceligenerans sp. TRM 65318]
MDRHQLQDAFDEIFDQALVFHGYVDYMRDYDLYIYATADPRTGIAPEHLRYRFTHCVRATATTTVRRDVWATSLGDEFTDHLAWERAGEPDGYVWGVRWQALYPGIRLLPESDEAARWASELGVPFHTARVETNAHDIELVFSDLRIDQVATGHVIVALDEAP